MFQHIFPYKTSLVRREARDKELDSCQLQVVVKSGSRAKNTYAWRKEY